MQYELSDDDKKNLLVFLSRAPLTGHETPAFNRLIDSMNNPIIKKRRKARKPKKSKS